MKDMIITQIDPNSSDDDNSLAACMQIRKIIFQDGQNVPKDIEIDGEDRHCLHFLAEWQGNPIGTCRIRPASQDSNEPFCKLERVGVLEQYRSTGVGKLLVEAAFNQANNLWPHLLLKTHSQTQVLGFYERLGMVIYTDVFYEANIAHYSMLLLPPKSQIPQLNILNRPEKYPRIINLLNQI